MNNKAYNQSINILNNRLEINSNHTAPAVNEVDEVNHLSTVADLICNNREPVKIRLPMPKLIRLLSQAF